MPPDSLAGLLHAFDRPALLLSVLVPVAVLLLAASCLGGLAASARARRGVLVAGVGALCVLTYGTWALHYPLLDRCFDHIEPTIVVATRLLDTGGPVYHELGAASRYATLYGPDTFVVPWLATRLSGDSLTGLKLVAAGFALASLLLTALALRRAATSSFARWCGLAFFAGAALLFREKLVWLRGDPQLLFWSALGLWGATRRRPAAAFALVGLALGASLDIKAHAPLYFAPLIALLSARKAPRRWALLIAGAALAAAAPFALGGAVSLRAYLGWLLLAPQQGFPATILFNNAVTLGHLLLPVALAGAAWLSALPAEARRDFLRRHRWGLALVALSLPALLVPASNLGGGEWHLLPLVPAAAWFLAAALSPRGTPEAARPGSGIVLGAYLVVAALQCGIVLTQLAQTLAAPAPDRGPVAADVRELAAKYAGQPLAMGYGGDATYAMTWARTELPPTPALVLDAGALMDMQHAGLELPAVTLDALGRGAVRLWLVPRRDEPFSLHSLYDGRDLFGPALRQAFSQHYRRIDQSRYFDVWSFADDG